MHREAGFTLLEIMVALVVLSLIVTTAFGALRMGERSWEAGLARAGDTETLRTVSGVLQRQFKQVLPLSWTEDAETTIAFSGNRQQLSFIAPAPQHHGSTGLFEYTLVVEPYQNNVQLVLYYLVHDPDSTGFQTGSSDRQRVLLVDELNTASFSYYGSPVDGNPPQWHAYWNNDAEAFPRLVRARLVSNEGQRPWPELVLALPAGLES
jgi:general secretion pathway protein J